MPQPSPAHRSGLRAASRKMRVTGRCKGTGNVYPSGTRRRSLAAGGCVTTTSASSTVPCRRCWRAFAISAASAFAGRSPAEGWRRTASGGAPAPNETLAVEAAPADPPLAAGEPRPVPAADRGTPTRREPLGESGGCPGRCCQNRGRVAPRRCAVRASNAAPGSLVPSHTFHTPSAPATSAAERHTQQLAKPSARLGSPVSSSFRCDAATAPGRGGAN